MSEVIVAKAGGTSNADAEAVRCSMEWAEQSNIFVVSAPGKLNDANGPEADKVTNLLLGARQQYLLNGEVSHATLDAITSRYDAIVRNLDGLSLPGTWIDSIHDRVEEVVRHSEDATSMLGEHLQAEVYQSSGFTLLDPGRSPKDLDAKPDSWREWLNADVDRDKKYVLPGNITRSLGRLSTFDRGGSDISGGLAAYGIRADLNINLTDGCAMSADPKRIDTDRLEVIDHLLYEEVRELGRNGTVLVHPAALVPLMLGDIPTEVRSTFDRSKQPTVLDNDRERAYTRTGRIVAMSLMEAVVIHQVHEPGMAEGVGRLADFEMSLASHGIPLVDSQGDGVDGQKYFVQAKHSAKAREAIDLVLHQGSITTQDNIDLVTLVGYNLQVRLMDHVFDLMLNSGINAKQWQAKGHDLSYGRHSIRLSLSPSESDEIFSRIHKYYFEG